jgi:beta-lactamase class C
MVPERDFGIAILWNSESSLPSGLLPTILDRAIGLTPGHWLDDQTESQTLYATKPQPAAGVDASTAEAMPE